MSAPETPLLGESLSIPKSAVTSKLGMMSKVAPIKSKISATNMAIGPATAIPTRPESAPSTSRSSYSLLSSSKSATDERADNKKNESAEKRKKEEKLKLKAEKEARKVMLDQFK